MPLNDLQQESYEWLPLHDAACNRIERFALLWIGTPYRAGVRLRGSGVDCAQLVPAFLDFMYRTNRALPIPRMSGDVSLHDARAALNTVRAVRRGFSSHVVRDGTIEPGDIIITRASHDLNAPRRTGHAMIALPRRGTALHAVPGPGVCCTTVQVTRGIVRVFRTEGKEIW